MKHVFLLILLSVCLICAGCSEKQISPMPSSDTAESLSEGLCLVLEGKSMLNIVRADEAHIRVTAAALELSKAFRSATGAAVTVNTDFMRGMKGIEGPAIYIGNTSEGKCSEIFGTLGYGDFIVTADYENGSLYLIGGSADATVKAVEYFTKTYLSENRNTLYFPADGYHTETQSYKFNEVLINGISAANYCMVYDVSSSYAKGQAEKLQQCLINTAGLELDVYSDAKDHGEYEIVVGGSSREEARMLYANADNPALYWYVTASGKKLIVGGDGIRATESAVDALVNMLNVSGGPSVDLAVPGLTGNVIVSASAQVPEVSELRVMTANVLLSENEKISTEKRAELFGETVDIYRPDVICFNEYYYRTAELFDERLKDDYVIFKPEFEDIFNGDYTGYTNSLEKLMSHECATLIAYRKDAGLLLIDSGFRYTTEKWWVHSISWALFQLPNGKRVAVSANHYGDQSVGNFGKETVQCCRDVRAEWGDVPFIVTGDLYAWSTDEPYKTIINAGFTDTYYSAAERVTSGSGSSHAVGSLDTGTKTPIDHILCSNGIKTLRHHLIADQYTQWVSDHFPIYADVILP